MNRIVFIFLSAFLLPFFLAAAPQPPSEDLAQKLERLDKEIDRSALELNSLVMEGYLKYIERARITAPVMTYPGFSLRAVCDTVPQIKALQEQLDQANAAYTAILKTDPEYEAIHREYVSLRGVKDEKRRADNLGAYNLLYERLKKNNPEYTAANERRQEALRVSNVALVRLIFEHYKGQGKVMPTDPLFRTYSDVMQTLRAEYPEIARHEEELQVLRRLRVQLNEQLQRERFGISADKPQSSPATIR